jgi:hypothetical protein
LHIVANGSGPESDAARADETQGLLEQRADLVHRAYACRCNYQKAVGAMSFDDLWEDQAHPWSTVGIELELRSPPPSVS